MLTTVGFAGSAASLFYVLRRWEVSLGAAALAGAVYGFSPALLHASIGHYNLQLAILPPLIIDAVLRLCLRSSARSAPASGSACWSRRSCSPGGAAVHLIAGVLLVAVLAAWRPSAEVSQRRAPAGAGLAVAAGVTLLLCGYALWVQFFGPLTQSGTAFLLDFFKNTSPRSSPHRPCCSTPGQRRGGGQVPGRGAGVPGLPGRGR